MHALLALVLSLQWGVMVGPAGRPARAQEPIPAPPTVTLSSPRYDASQEAYLLDALYTRSGAIEYLIFSVTNQEGVEVARQEVFPAGRRNQSVVVDAAALHVGQTYRIEVTGFGPDGGLLFSGQGNAVLAARELTHAPEEGLPHLGVPDFVVRLDPPSLTIDLQVTEQEAIERYRVILKDGSSNVVVLDESLGGPPPLLLALTGVPAKGYVVEIRALGAGGELLTAVTGEFSYESLPVTLGELLFTYEKDPPRLTIRLDTQGDADVASYAVSLISRTINEVVLDYTTREPPPLVVPLEDVASGELRVLVRALDAGGGLLGSSEGETTYFSPAGPSASDKVRWGLLANPLIPLAIGVIFVALVTFLALRFVMDKRATATPVLRSGVNLVDNIPQLPLNRTAMLEAGPRSLPAPKEADVPALALTVVASPDAAQAGRRVPLDHFPFTIGRGGCDLDLSGDSRVSRVHLEIGQDHRGIFIVDRLSSNGTYLQGERIAAERPVTLDARQSNRISLGRDTHLLLEPART